MSEKAHDIFRQQFNAASIFVDDHIEKGRADRPAILCGERTASYGDLYKNVNRFGNILNDRGIGREERVAILLPDIPEFAFAFFGAIKTGAVAVPLNTFLGPGEYKYTLNDSRARLLVVHISLLESILPVRDRLKYLEHILVCGGNAEDYPRLEDLLKSASATLKAADVSRDDTAFWLYSSGTTGAPKGTMHRHYSMLVPAERFAKQTLGIGESDLCFSVAKLFFAYGLGNGLYFPLRVGGTSVLLPEKPLPEAVFDVIDRYQPTVFYSVPTSYAALLQTAERENRNSLGRVRMCVSAGEPLPKPLFERWRDRFGMEILDGIGATEALQTFISNRPGEARGGSTGKLVPGYDAKIVDDQGNELPSGEVGTLLLRGESIASGYWKKYEETKRTFIGEWLDTRDKFRVDEEGFYYYVGRSDDMMKVGGQWVSPTELEAALQQHPAVLESGVVGIVDEQGLTNPAAYTVLKEGILPSSGLALELQGFVRENTAPYRYSCWVEFVDDLPKTATGKIQRFRLREMNGKQSTSCQQEVQGCHLAIENSADLMAQLQGLDDIEAQRDMLEKYVRSQLAIVLGLDDSEPIHSETNFFSNLGMNSVAAAALANRLQVGLRYPLSATLLFKYSSLDALLDYIAGEALIPETAQSNRSKARIPDLVPISRQDNIPLSFAERRFWLYQTANPDSCFHNLPHCLQLTGKLNIEVLEQSFNAVICRHEILRTTFPGVDGSPVQSISPVSHVNLTIKDLQGLSKAAQLNEVKRLTDEEIQHRPFDLASGPLLRVTLMCLGEESHILLLCTHHIILDAWSLEILLKELVSLYTAGLSGNLSPLLPLPIQYADYAVWQHRVLTPEVRETKLDYWRQWLIKGEPPPLELPTDRQRLATVGLAGTVYYRLPSELVGELKVLSQRTGGTMFTTVVTALAVVLYRYSGCRDIVIGSPFANRNRPELEQMIGVIGSTLLLRFNISDNPRFSDVLHQARQTVQDAMANQDLPFEEITKILQPEHRQHSSPLFRVLISFLPMALTEELVLPGVTMRSIPLDLDGAETRLDLSLTMWEKKTPSESFLQGWWRYRKDLFDEETAVRITENFQAVLEAAAAGLEIPVDELPVDIPNGLG